MFTLSLLGAKFFGDKEMKESIDREGFAVWPLGIFADIGSFTILHLAIAALVRFL